MKIDEAQDFRVGNTPVQGIYVGSTLVWPTAYTYEIVNIYINYSAGSVIYARGSFATGGNYAYLTGDIRRTRGGSSEILYNQPLTPVFDTTQSVFSIDSQGHITAQSRGTVEGSILSASLHGTYQDAVSPTSVTVRQEANAIVQTIVNGATVNLGGYSPSGIACTATSFSMTAYIERDITQVFTSTAEKDTTDTQGTMRMTFGSTSYNVTNGQSKTFAVSNNKHTTTSKQHTVSLSYDTYSTSATITQAADTYTTSTRNTDYDCEIYKNTDRITASGGTCTLVWNAWHIKETLWTWGSDGQVDVKSRDEVEDTVTPVESLDTYNGFSRSGTTVTHLTMADNSRLSKRGQTATEKARYTVTNNGVSDYVEFEVTNSYYGKKWGTPTVSYSGLDNDIYYDGTEIPVRVGISQQSWQEYDAGNYDTQTEGGSALVSSITGTAYSGGYKSGSYIGAGELSTTTARRRVYVISSVRYTDLSGTSRTYTSSKTIYQESLDVTPVNSYDFRTFTIDNVTSKTIGAKSTSNMYLYADGRERTDTNYNAGNNRKTWTDEGSWSSYHAVTAGISGSGSTSAFTYPSTLDSYGEGTVKPTVNTSTSSRTLTLTATWGGKTKTVTITQSGVVRTYGIELGSARYIFPASGGSHTIVVYGITYEDGEETDRTRLYASSLTISGTVTRVSRSGLDLSANHLPTTSYSATSGNITIKWSAHTSATATFATGQEANKVESTETSYDRTLVVPVSSYPAAGGSYTVTGRSFLITESTWTSGDSTSTESATSSSISATNASCRESSVSGSYSFTLTVPESDSSVDKYVRIYMAGVLMSELKQAAASYVLNRINPTTSVIPQVAYNATSFTITVEAKIGSASAHTYDITADQMSGMGISLGGVVAHPVVEGYFNITFNCTANTTTSVRSGSLRVKYGDKNLTYSVTQEAKPQQEDTHEDTYPVVSGRYNFTIKNTGYRTVHYNYTIVYYPTASPSTTYTKSETSANIAVGQSAVVDSTLSSSTYGVRAFTVTVPSQ